MLKKIRKYLEKPKVFTESKINFWNDEYISKKLLLAHLNPDFEGASRKLEFIEKSVSWIEKIMLLEDRIELLDIGCGPGIYAERLFKKGFQVTGIDFSKRSVEYAKKSAEKQKLKIKYEYQNYLHLNLNEVFDSAVLIYCDYGALSAEKRKLLMKSIYKSLKNKGRFLLDVFSILKYNNFEESKTWESTEYNGFWCEENYMALNGNYKYENNITLEQTVIITNDEIREYYIWNQYFSPESLIEEAKESGFKVLGLFGDVAGTPYEENSDTIALLLEK